MAIALALATHRILLSLGTAVVVGGLLSSPAATQSPLQTVGRCTGFEFLLGSATDELNQQILLYVVLIMAMISVMLTSGGLHGVAAWLMKFARSVRSAKLATIAAGLVIFIDDYANTMIVGSTMRSLTDRQRISREKLAFLVDATAAPIAGLAVISTWIGVEVGLLTKIAAKLGAGKDGYSIFFDALPFRFYCIGMIAFVFFNAFSGKDFGPMATAERRARKSGKLLADGARPMTSRTLSAAEPHPQAVVRSAVALVPMVAVLAVFLGLLWLCGDGRFLCRADPWAPLHLSQWREALRSVESIPLLAIASGTGLAAALVLSLTVARLPVFAMARAVVGGVRGSLMPVSVLLLAWSLKGACDELGTGKYLADALSQSVSPLLFPAMVFVVAALTSFATGTSWGTMAILIPTAVPVAYAIDGGYGLVTIVSVAAILDGSIFGDHCSPISDTTIMSSTASACDHLDHVRTQMPYALVVAAVALAVGYLPVALGLPNWAALLGGIAVLGGLFVLLPHR